jgi:hypothetical protein
MNRPANIIEAVTPGGILAPLFPKPETWVSWHVFEKALYGLPINEQEMDVFRFCTGLDQPRPGGYSEAWAICGRRSGKSRTAATVALFEAILGGWETRRAPGEEVWVQILACDKSQASIILGYIRAGLELFPDLIKSQTTEEIHLESGIAIGVKAASLRGTRGYTTCLLIADEASFWRDAETSANPMDEILAAVTPGLLDGGKLMVVTTPYAKFGTVYQTYRDFFGQADSDVLVWQAPSNIMNPELSEGLIKRLLVRSKLMRSEFEATFREDISNLFSEIAVDHAADLDYAPPDPTLPWVAFIDPSGGASDSFTMALARQTKEGQLLIGRVEERVPPFVPTEVVREFSDVLKQFGVRLAVSDRYAGCWPTEAFRAHGIRVDMSDLTASEIYLEASALMNSGRVHLPRDDERLRLQLQLLERRVSPGGRDRVDHPVGGHDDRAVAAMGAAVLASRNTPWTEEEQTARLPVSRHGIPKEYERPEVASTRVRQSAEAELRDFMVGSGCNEIVKPGMRRPWTPPREHEVGEVVTVGGGKA